jgi:DNA invertase Pin-like site-specific DNA recombinase
VPTALLYCRVSTQEQATEGYSLDAQERQLRAFCESQGWTVGARYIVEGASGGRLGRPQLQAMLQDLEAHRFPEPCVVVWRLDRLTRSVADLYTLLATFERLGAAFRSSTEPYDTASAIGRLFVTLVAALAQWKRDNLMERYPAPRRGAGLLAGAQQGDEADMRIATFGPSTLPGAGWPVGRRRTRRGITATELASHPSWRAVQPGGQTRLGPAPAGFLTAVGTKEARHPGGRGLVYRDGPAHPFNHGEGLLVDFDVKALLVTFGLVFLAELGDNTPLSF